MCARTASKPDDDGECFVLKIVWHCNVNNVNWLIVAMLKKALSLSLVCSTLCLCNCVCLWWFDASVDRWCVLYADIYGRLHIALCITLINHSDVVSLLLPAYRNIMHFSLIIQINSTNYVIKSSSIGGQNV